MSRPYPDFVSVLTLGTSALLVLRTWLQGESENWTQSRELLLSIRDFARSVGGSDTMKAAAQEIADRADEKVCVTDINSQTCAV